MFYVVKAALDAEARPGLLTFDEKTMWRGKDIRAGDAIFVFASDHEGGRGLCAKGVVTFARRGEGIRVGIKVRPTAWAKRALGRAEFKPWRGLKDGSAQAELAHKLYVQATNKIAGISDAAAAFLDSHF